MPTPAATRWRVVAAVIGVGVTGALMVGKVPAALPLLRDELDLSLVSAGWVASIFNLCAAVLGIAAGLTADRLGPARTMVGGLVLLSAGGALGALATGAVGLTAARVVEGLGFVAAVVAGPGALIDNAEPRHRSLVLGLWSGYMPAGAALALLGTPFLIELTGWRGVWVLGAVLAGLSALVVRGIVTDPPAGVRQPRRLSDVADTLALPGPWLYAAAFLLYSAQFFAVLTWLPTFLIETQGYDLAAAATVGALVVLANVGGTLAGTVLMHRGVPRWRLLVGALLPMMVCAWGIFDAAAPDALRVSAALAFSLIGGLLPAAGLAGAAHHARRPEETATCSGVVVQGANAGSLLGAPAMAVTVGSLHGWGNAWWMMVVFGTTGAALALLLRNVEHKRFG